MLFQRFCTNVHVVEYSDLLAAVFQVHLTVYEISLRVGPLGCSTVINNGQKDDSAYCQSDR